MYYMYIIAYKQMRLALTPVIEMAVVSADEQLSSFIELGNDAADVLDVVAL